MTPITEKPLSKAISGFMEGFAERVQIIPEAPEIKPFDKEDYRRAKGFFLDVLDYMTYEESGGRQENYILDSQSTEATAKAFYFATNQKEKGEQFGIDVRKGILIAGNPGSGKSILGRAMKYCGDKYDRRGMFIQFHHCTCKAISLDYKEHGMKKVEIWTRYQGPETLPVYFEDIGKEDKVGHFEATKELMDDILQLRYDLFLKYGLKTMGDTNMDLNDIEKRYGAHIVGRIRQTMNIVGLGASEDYMDRRKLL